MDGVTGKAAEQESRPAGAPPYILRNKLVGRGGVWKDVSRVGWFPFYICGGSQGFAVALAMSHGLKHSWIKTWVLGTCEHNAHIHSELMCGFHVLLGFCP